MLLSAIRKARLRLILDRHRLPAITATVESFDLGKNEASGVAICEVRVMCSREGKPIPLYFRIIAPELEVARRDERYLLLSRILAVGNTVQLHYKPGMKFLGYVLAEEVYPQAEPAIVAQALPVIRSLFLVGAFILVGAILLSILA